jgi:hypothetical protein
VQIGNKTYSKSKAIYLLGKYKNSDISVALAKQLITAKLNVANGAPSSCIASTIVAADNWLRSNSVGCRASYYSSSYKTAKTLTYELYSYNMGEECAEACDDKPVCKYDWYDAKDCDYDFSKCRKRKSGYGGHNCGWR